MTQVARKITSSNTRFYTTQKFDNDRDFYDQNVRKNIHGISVSLTLSGLALSVVCLAGGEGLRVPDAKNQGYYQPIEMKLCTSHNSHKGMPDAKF